MESQAGVACACSPEAMRSYIARQASLVLPSWGHGPVESQAGVARACSPEAMRSYIARQASLVLVLLGPRMPALLGGRRSCFFSWGHASPLYILRPHSTHILYIVHFASTVHIVHIAHTLHIESM